MIITVEYQSNWEEGTADGYAKIDTETGEIIEISEGTINLNGEDDLESLIGEEIYYNDVSFEVTANESETGYDYCLTGEELDRFKELLTKHNTKSMVAVILPIKVGNNRADIENSTTLSEAFKANAGIDVKTLNELALDINDAEFDINEYWVAFVEDDMKDK